MREWILFLSFFLLTGCSWGPSFFNSKGNSDELTAGINYFQKSNFIKAKSVFTHLIGTQIGSSEIEEAQWHLAMISEKLDPPQIALKNQRNFLKNYPASSHKKESEERIKAIDQEVKASEEKKEKNSSELKRGMQYIQEGDFIQAKGVFLQIVSTEAEPPLIEDARWYLALISEKLDSPEIARQNFKEFLRKYPSTLHQEEAEDRIRGIEQRGHLLPAENGKGASDKKGTTARVSSPQKRPDRVSGVLVTEYLYDQTLSPDPAMNTQSRLSEFFDLRWRKGSGPDLRVNFSAMNVNDFLRSQNNRERLNKLFLEGNHIGWFSNFRIGRQPSTGSTLFNRFDGLSFSLPFSPLTWTNNFGIPVDVFSRDPLAIQSDKKFYDTYLSVTDYYHLTGRIYLTQEYFQGFSTRKAIGLNGFWMMNNLNITTLLDRDLDFNKFNDGMVNFDYARSNVHYSGMVEYRRNPFLDYGMALTDSYAVSNQITSLDVLQQTKSRDEIMEMALNNSHTTLDYSLGVSIDLTSIWRTDFRYGKTFYDPGDFGSHLLTVPLVNSQRTTDRYSIFILERNLFNQNEIASALFLYQPGTDSSSSSAIANIIKIWSSGFTGGLRFRYEEASFASSGNTLSRLVPGFVLRFTSKRGMEASLEGDYVMEQNSLSPDWNNTIQTRTSVSIPF
jgi:outer membrane protein assembly factor BamD (BamD/ComL family)